MKNFIILVLLVFSYSLAAKDNIENDGMVFNNTVSGFERIKLLVGDWQGTLPDGKPIDISYRMINGGMILEQYHSKNPMWWNMSSAYHLDNNKIMMTHYCSWGNHPRMSAIVPSGDVTKLQFNFIDMTQTQPSNGYMHNSAFNFQDRDHFTHHWTWRDKGKDTPLMLALKRKKADHKK